MLAIPIDKLLQRMDEIEKECLNGVDRWRKLREQLEDEAAQQGEVRLEWCGCDYPPPPTQEDGTCSVCGKNTP